MSIRKQRTKESIQKTRVLVSTFHVFPVGIKFTQDIMVTAPWFGLLKLDICVSSEPDVMVNHH
jgi:hypothetical protein